MSLIAKPAEGKTGLPLFDIFCDDEPIRRNVTAEHAKRDFREIELPPPNPQLPEVGDKWTFTLATDSHACYVESVNKKGTVLLLREAKATLLNPPNSDKPNALHFSPGGFCGHTSGEQEWHIEPNAPGIGRLYKVSLRFLGTQPVWKECGHPTRSPGMSACPGHHHHYDFNF